LTRSAERLAPIVQQLQQWGVRVSLFMDPDVQQIALAKQVGADRIELYTGPYAEACASGENVDAVFQTFYRAAETAADLGLGLNAGHDLNLHNLTRFATVPQLLEVSIGHAFTVDAIRLGLANAVAAYQRCLGKPL
jgi:pyridoxine 5-phosphate synthase